MPPAATLAAKLKLKPNTRAAIVRGKFDWVQIFVKNQAEISALAPRAVAALKPESLLWISFPKGSSKMQTDLTRDKGWEALHDYDLRWVNLVSVNDAWSAFAMRPLRAGETRQPWS